MNKFPDNFRCVLYNNNYYFTHWFNASISGNSLKLYYIYTDKNFIENDNAYESYTTVKQWPMGNNMEEVVKEHFKNNLSYKDKDFSKDTFVEIPFGELPENVKTIFRRFEEHKGFKISEGVSFYINNIKNRQDES